MQEIFIGNGQTEYHLHSTNQRLPSYVERGVEGVDGPTMRIDAYNNPGIAGETVAQVLPGGSLIALSGALRAIHDDDQQAVLASYKAEREDFAKAITHTYSSLGRAQPLLLRFTDMTGRQLQAEVYRDRYSAPLELPTHNRWRLQLRNPSGIVQSQTLAFATVASPIQGGVVFDIVGDAVFSESSGGQVTATNAGTVESKPIIKLYGPMTNPIITNTTTNERIALDHVMLAGEVITIDTAASTIIQGTNTNRMGKLRAGSVLWSLQPGTNTISLEALEHTDGYVEVQWRDSFAGI